MTNAFGLGRIAQIAVNVRDVDRAQAFYRDVLGVKELFRAPNLAFFDCGGTRLMLGVPEKPEFDHPTSIIYFDVPDIEAAHEALGARGVAFVDTPHFVAPLGPRDLWMCFFRDSEGNLLGLQSEKARPQTA